MDEIEKYVSEICEAFTAISVLHILDHERESAKNYLLAVYSNHSEQKIDRYLEAVEKLKGNFKGRQKELKELMTRT